MKFVDKRRTRIKSAGSVKFRENRTYKSRKFKLAVKNEMEEKAWKMENLEKKGKKNGVKMKQVRNRKQNEQSGHCKRRNGENAWKTEFVINRKKANKMPGKWKSQNEQFTEKIEENAQEMNNLIKTGDSE